MKTPHSHCLLWQVGSIYQWIKPLSFIYPTLPCFSHLTDISLPTKGLHYPYETYHIQIHIHMVSVSRYSNSISIYFLSKTYVTEFVSRINVVIGIRMCRYPTEFDQFTSLVPPLILRYASTELHPPWHHCYLHSSSSSTLPPWLWALPMHETSEWARFG